MTVKVLLAAAISVALVSFVAVAQTPAPTQAPSDPAAAWHVPSYLSMKDAKPFAPHWARRLTGYLTARDGTKLRYSVLLPAGNGPFPVIINYSGYDPGAIGGYAYLRNDTAMSARLDSTLLDHGYAVMGVNARGTGCSEGTFDFLGPAYGTDGADAVEWTAKQSWSTGAIGMANWSWAGMSQVATASNRPAHLKAVAPGMVLTDPRGDSWEIGGVPSYAFVTTWWQFLHSRWLAVRQSAAAEHDQRCVAQVDRNYAAGQTPAINLPSQLLRHPMRDGWIDNRTILDRANQINVPMLSMEAFQDEATTARGGYYQSKLDPDRLWLVQTNGNHDLYESLRYRRILVAFLDHFVKGLNNGFERQPHLEVWMETKSDTPWPPNLHDEHAVPSWVIQRDRLPAAVGTLTLTLSGDHRLNQDGKTGGAPDSYTYPVPGPAVDTDPYHAAWGPLSAGWRQGSVAYTGAPLKNDTVIYGPVSADLWLSTTQSDTDVQVTLTDVRPDGQEEYVQRGWLRLSDRALDQRRSTPHLPVRCDRPECIDALTPDVPVLGRVELTKVTYAFRAGSRIRIWIDTPSATGANDFDHSSLPATDKIWHDAMHPSRIVFGTLKNVEVPPTRPACGSALMQPCRADPLAH